MFCEKCGNNLQEGATFCEKCGAPVGAKATASGDYADKAYDALPKFPLLAKQTGLNGISYGKLFTILSVVVLIVLLVFGSWLRIQIDGKNVSDSYQASAGMQHIHLFTLIPFADVSEETLPDWFMFMSWVFTIGIIGVVVLFVMYLKGIFAGNNDSKYAIWASIGTFAIFFIMFIVELLVDGHIRGETEKTAKLTGYIGTCLPFWLCLLGSFVTAYLAKNTERE